ncbi:MAG: RNA-binding protein [Methanobacteriota archaeon]|nr:MAG: RNA-binding protein [Euryarchaeota archaeon]
MGTFFKQGKKISVRPLKGRYYPKVGDIVIGLVEDVALTSFSVNIGGPYPAILLVSNATNAPFDPIKDDARKIFKAGDAIRAEIISFDRTKDPQLNATKEGLGKLVGGRIIDVNPMHVRRIIGRKGSMINLIKEKTKTKIIVGHNGRIWIRGDELKMELLATEAIEKIVREAHVSGLTDRVAEFLSERS